MEACDIDQFEMHLRAILSLPCPAPTMRTPVAMMINVLGKDTVEETKRILHQALHIPGTGIHWYGKEESRKGRKMAHFTITASSIAQLKERIAPLASSIPSTLTLLPPTGPRVGIIMGSDSDLSTMQDAAKICEQFHVSFEMAIVSAHRTPTRMYSYAQTAIERGLQVIIAGAGGAAHLPGMVASLTSLPVIGVPIKTSILNGNDSLLSIVQMPKGIPVATVAIGNAANAALLAIRILGAQDSVLQKEMDTYLMNQEEDILRKSAKLESIGYEAYLKK
jgi:phosphoribosylaminoimidazole carboxylase